MRLGRPGLRRWQVARSESALVPPMGTAEPGRDRRIPALAGAEHGLIDLLRRYSPREGWATLAILWGLVLVVGVTIQQAEWTDTPGMILIVLLSSLAGLALAKARWPWPVLIVLGLALGVVIVYWQASRLVQDETFIGSIRQTALRLNDWYQAAVSGGISTDLMPFSMALLGGGWLLGFFSTWFLFRRRYVWPALILGGLALFTHISFLPSERIASFFVFVALSMLLIVRMGFVHSRIGWGDAGTRFSAASAWVTMAAALVLSALVLAIAASIPLNVYVSKTVASVWTQARTPVSTLESGLSRLVTGIASKKNIHGRPFGDNLPFLGPINFNGEVVFMADTEYPSYWLSRTYSEYTPKGWVAGETKEVKVGPETVPPPQGDALKRTAVPQSLMVHFDSTSLLAGGNLEWLNREATIEVLSPKSFEIGMADPSGEADFPADVQALATELRTKLSSPLVSFVESEVAKLIPDDLVVTHIDYSQAGGKPQVDSVTLQRKESISPDVVSFEFNQQLIRGETYDMVSLVSTATNEDLRRAGRDYDASITDHYLQLPGDLPERVRELARRLTGTADTTLDKARAIETYLRGESFTYSQDIESPPTDSDGVDHFLFETRTGYSDYFASAMAVMLRSVGVPARLAAGYAPGEFDEASGLNAVRDSDSHAWVQVYFPEFGWIDFEPTPAWPDPYRQIGRPASGGQIVATADVPDQEAAEFQGFVFPAQLSAIGLGVEGGFEGEDRGIDVVRMIVLPIIAVIVALLVVVAALQALWNLALRGLALEQQIYAKMARLGGLAGVGRYDSQTPREYASSLAATLPGVAGEAALVATRYSAVTYGAPASSSVDDYPLRLAWKLIRGALVGRIARRLVPRGWGQSD